MDEVRLPAHMEVGGLVRRINAQGGFATVIRKGEPDAGTILLVLTENGANLRVYERMPQVDGKRKWLLSKSQDVDLKEEINEYLSRRSIQDRDLWIVELDIPDGERFIPES
jgi:hypothetical protein